MGLSGKAKGLIFAVVFFLGLVVVGLIIWYIFYVNPMVGSGLNDDPTLNPFPTTQEFVDSFESQS